MNRENASYRNPVHRAEHGNLSLHRVTVLTSAGDIPGSILGLVNLQPQKTVYYGMTVHNKAVAGLLVDIGYRNRLTGEFLPQAFAKDFDLTAASPAGGTELLLMPYAMDGTNVDDIHASCIHDLIATVKGTVADAQSFQIVLKAVYTGT